MIRRNLPLVVFTVLASAALLAEPAAASWDNWNCNLLVHWGALDGVPGDEGDYLGVQPEATDGYDLIDSKKPGEPLGSYVYAWFERPDWGKGRIMADWRAPIPEGASKQWGTGFSDTWKVKTNLDNGPSGYFDETCDHLHELEYPIAGSIYITWEFGMCATPPAWDPPEDYAFTLIYRGGINAKPAGTKLSDAMDPPPWDTAWDMEATPHLVLPLWNESFQPWTTDCLSFDAPDTARFYIRVYNPPDPTPECAISVDPAGPQGAPATFTFSAAACCDEPFTFAWDFGDGATGTGSPVMHTYGAGLYTVTCTATDCDGDIAVRTAVVEVTPCAPPVCCFSYAPEHPEASESAQFTDCSTSYPPCAIVSWAWDFGDGGVSSEQNATHQYGAAGTYEVCLTVADDEDQAATCCHSITVVEANLPPECSVSGPAGTWRGEEVWLTATASDPEDDPLTYSWDLDGGVQSGSSGNLEVLVSWETLGVKNVCLTVTDDHGGASTCCAAIEIVNLWPTCDITVRPETPLVGHEADFDAHPSDIDGTVVSVDWDFGDGGAASGNPVAHIYAAAGAYLVTATVTDNDGDARTCELTVHANEPPVCMLDGPTVGVPDEQLCFSAAGSYDPDGGVLTYFWDMGIGTLVVPLVNPSFETAEGWTVYRGSGPPNDFDFCYFAPRTGSAFFGGVSCWGVTGAGIYQQVDEVTVGETYTAGIWINSVSWMPGPVPAPQNVHTRVGIDPLGGTDPVAPSVAWSPDFSNDNCGPGPYIKHEVSVVAAAPTLTVFCEYWNDLALEWEMMAMDDVTLTTGPTFGKEEIQCVAYPEPGTYTVTLTVIDDEQTAISCTREVTIAGNQSPTCAITYAPADPEIDDPITFHSNSADPDGIVVSWAWDFGDGDTASGDPAAHQYAAAGSYTVSVTVTDNEGAHRTCSTEVRVRPPNQPPTCCFIAPATAGVGGTVHFADCCTDDGTIVSWSWDFGDGGTSSAQNPTHQFQAEGVYDVCLGITDDGIPPLSALCCQTIAIEPGNQPPTCDIAYSPSSPDPGDVVSFDSQAADPDGTVMSASWDFGDGATGSGVTVSHQYLAAGTYIVAVTVHDDGGAWASCTRQVIVSAVEPPGNGSNWNGNLQVYWGSLGGVPSDTGDFFGVQPGATDGYDLIDSKKPCQPLGDYVYAWFERPAWGQGRIMADWRSEIAEGTSKRWGTNAITDTWNVKTNLDNGGSGYHDPTCDIFNELEYPIAADIYISWEFGVAEEPPYPTPPEDYTFTIIYRSGINAKPAGTESPSGAPVPAANTAWDMEATPYIVMPLWNEAFGPWTADCTGFEATDTAKFLLVVNNPVSENQPPTCDIAYSPSSPYPGDVVSFDSQAADPDGTVASASWDFGDGAAGSGVTTSHQYLAAGTYIVAVTVYDDGGAWASCTRQVIVSAVEPPSDGSNWNGNLQAYWGSPSGSPADTGDFFGAQPDATDDYDVIDSKKPSEPLGDNVFAWFERPAWGQGRIMADWRAPIPEGTSKQWGPAINDTWNIKTNLDNGPSGYFDDTCDPWHELEYPIAASIYLAWEFGVSEAGPSPLPPDDYTFTLIYRRGINPKPAGTQLPDAMTPPAPNTTWDMESTPGIVLPLWNEAFQPFREDCSAFAAADTARFHILVHNPDTIPACDIAVSPPGPVPFPATFTFTATACCDEPFVFTWDFGDGATDMGNPVSHSYAAWGDYTVVCVVTDVDGDSATCTASVTPLPPPNAPPECCFSYEPAVPDDVYPVQFTDCSTDPDGVIVAWAWDFGDGGTSTEQNPTHQLGVGSYDVCLTVTDDGYYPMSATCCQALAVGHVNLPPPCDITYAPADPTADDVVNFNSNASDPDGVIVSVDWDFGDGATASGDPVGHQYAMPGAYGVTVTVCDNDGACTTCEAEIEVGKGANLPPVCDVSYEPMDPVAAQEITFSANAWDPNPWGEIVAYEWDFGDGATANGDPVGHTYGQWAAYTVCVTVTDDQGGQTTCCAQVVVTWPCECDLAIDPTHCKMPAAGHVGQCKTGQIGARSLSYTEPCDALLRVTDNAGNIVFETTQTIDPGCGLRIRFSHCYTADEVGNNLWRWEVFPLGCHELTPWNNVHHRRVIVHP